MNNYDIKTLSIEELLEKEDYSFFVKRSKDIFDVYTKRQTSQTYINFLSSHMGAKSDEFLEKFLLDMANVSKIIINEESKFYSYISLLMFIFLDINNDGDLLKGGYAYASHSQGFFTFFKKYDEIKKYFEENFQKNYLMIQQSYNNYIEAKNDLSLFYKAPKDSIEIIKNEVRPYILRNEIYFSNFKTDDPTLNGLLLKSNFHKDLYHTIDLNDIDFQVKRFSIICQYYFLNNLGLSYEKRCFLCYSIYRYVEEKYNFSYEKK